MFIESSGAANVVYEVLVPLVYLSHHFQVAKYITAAVLKWTLQYFLALVKCNFIIPTNIRIGTHNLKFYFRVANLSALC